ncbi:MAG: nucleoside phosphorylase [Owenweeksia sp.]
MRKSSELIVNSDGSLYHLALKAGEVATKIITVGDPDRVQGVSRHFDRIEMKRSTREFVSCTGYIGAERLTVISTGIGTDNIDIVMNELHSLFHTNLQTGEPLNKKVQLTFLRLGTSGTIRENIPIDSILASEAALGFDGLMHFYQYDHGNSQVDGLLSRKPALKEVPKPYLAEGDAGLLNFFEGCYKLKGITVTAPGFYAPQGRHVNAAPRLGDFTNLLGGSEVGGRPVTNIEMETAGIYGMASLFGHRALSLSAILANRITGEFSKAPSKTVNRLIEAALEKLIELR